jgi:DNA replication and repair protein RecF
LGGNGSGKTHILEGIHLLCQAHIPYALWNITSGAYFEGMWEAPLVGTKIFSRTKKERWDEYNVQKTKISRGKYFIELPFRTVFLSPFDMNLLYFSPSLRREYIDWILEQRYEQFSQVKKEYDHILRERNALLKNIRDGISKESELDFWDKSFIKQLEVYMLYRTAYFEHIRTSLAPILSKYLSKYTITFEPIIHPSVMTGDTLWIQTYLSQNRPRDIITGHTHIWPHRDDISFSLTAEDATYDVTSYLSRGEMKLLLLVLKLLEISFLESEKKEIILLIDDIFAELDEENISRFLKSLTPYQVILTSQKPLPGGENWSEFTCINLKDS